MRFLNIGFIVLFMAILILPLMFIDLSKDRVSLQENRMLAEHPKLADIKKNPIKFIQDFDAWFKDSTGFREQLISIYNAMGMNTLMNSVMYKKGEHAFLIGENGHRFYGGENGVYIRKVHGENILSDEQLVNLADKLEKVRVFLNGKGIPFVLMLCPFKELIYPEFYPKSINQGAEPVQIDVITDYIRENTGIDVFNIRKALLAEKDNYLLYPVSSGDLSHYTEIGAFFAYRELMKHINTYYPDIVPFDINDIVITYDKQYRYKIFEPNVSLKKEQTYKKLDSSFFNDIDKKWLFPWEFAAYENKDKNLPVILVFRDSYSGVWDKFNEKKFLTQFLASHFGKAVFIHWFNIKNLKEYVNKYKPDIVLFETIGNVEIFAESVNEIPELTKPSGGEGGSNIY